MKAITQDHYGTPEDALQLRDVDTPAVKDGDVLVRVQGEMGRLWQMNQLHSAEEHLGSRLAEELLEVVKERSKTEIFFRIDVKPQFEDTPQDWEDRLEATFT